MITRQWTFDEPAIYEGRPVLVTAGQDAKHPHTCRVAQGEYLYDVPADELLPTSAETSDTDRCPPPELDETGMYVENPVAKNAAERESGDG